MSLMDLIWFRGLIWKQPGFACFHDRDHSSDTLPRKCRGIKERLFVLASGGQGTRLCENPGNTDTIPRKHSRICLGRGVSRTLTLEIMSQISFFVNNFTEV